MELKKLGKRKERKKNRSEIWILCYGLMTLRGGKKGRM